ncbi:DNA cytosine methyltransferase [Rhizobiaceae bacterium]|nr:DNA cytosine methyltransferase [Rhizobiaceae bacterium]
MSLDTSHVPRTDAASSAAIHDDTVDTCGTGNDPKHFRTAIDLFAGAGGFSLGAVQAGFEVRAAVEHCGHAAATYRSQVRNSTNRKIEMFEKDILNLSPTDVLHAAGLMEGECSLLLGGPPCQGFSSHRLGNAGVDDPRNELLLRYFAFVKTIRPRAFLLENVPGLLQSKHADYLEAFLRLAEEHDYAIDGPVVLNARDYGVPQNRQRVFVLGVDRRTDPNIGGWMPQPSHGSPAHPGAYGPVLPYRTAADAFDRDARSDDPNNRHMKHGADLIAVFESTPLNGGSREQSNRVLDCHRNHSGHKDVYGRIDPSKPSPTMTTACINPSKGRFVHPTRPHGITARQAARLQTFPETFEFTGGLMAAGVQIGNAVPVLLARTLCSSLIDHLGDRSARSATYW